MIPGILLAAGESLRMGDADKMLLPIRGTPLVSVAAENLLDAGLAPLIAVTGHRAAEVEQALSELPVSCVTNPSYAKGMGTSLAVGVAALPPAAEWVVIALGDMPGIRPGTIRRLLDSRGAQGIVAPVYQDRRGHPVVFDLRRYREQLAGLDGDQGARAILQSHPEDVTLVSVDDPGVALDLDTREQYEAWIEGRK